MKAPEPSAPLPVPSAASVSERYRYLHLEVLDGRGRKDEVPCNTPAITVSFRDGTGSSATQPARASSLPDRWLAKGLPSHSEAEATACAAVLLVDSFQLPLPEDRVDTDKRCLLEELGQEYDIAECDGAEDIETLLEGEMDRFGRENTTTFCLCDLGTVVRKYEQWNSLMPEVRPFYAVKSNPDLAILKTLRLLGTGFDCASQQELELVLNLGVSPNDIVFANPCKMKHHILFAKQRGVRKMTFDNVDELDKIAEFFPEAEVILRILPPNTDSALCNFGSKFGANRRMVKVLFKRAHQLGINVCGISFHVGSGCWDVSAYVLAIQEAHSAMTMGREKYGFRMNIFDIGGGFPVADNLDTLPSLPQIVDEIGPLLRELFPKESGVSLIAEPGRYFCGEAVVLAVSVIAKRAHVPASSNTDTSDVEIQLGTDELEVESDDHVLYYLSDGVYGSFNNIMFDHQNPTPKLSASTKANITNTDVKKSTLFGPTCDSIDVICRDVHLPEIEVGSFLYFMNMGAYTSAAASSFNGFSPPPTRYILT